MGLPMSLSLVGTVSFLTAFSLARIQKKSVCELERQEPVNLGRVVVITFQMSVDKFSDRVRIDIWT